jgi:hypothetical protein
MKRGVFCLALFGWPMCGAETSLDKAPVALYVRFEHQPPADATETLQRELRSILSPAGFDFEWRSVDSSANEVWADLAVVTFKGSCAAEGLVRKPRLISGALGWTHVSDGKILPFAEVDCDRISAYLGPQLFAVPFKNREIVFQRALARVAAHELYHVFIQTAAHGSWGIAKAEFTTEELLSDSFHFQKAEARTLRHKGAEDLLRFALRGR